MCERYNVFVKLCNRLQEKKIDLYDQMERKQNLEHFELEKSTSHIKMILTIIKSGYE
jgi:hypothetical protein